MSTSDKLRESLRDLLVHEGERVVNGIGLECDSAALEKAKQRANEALAADDTARGTMREEFEAWWTREGATMCIGSSQSIARAAWQASRAAAPQGEVVVTKNKSGQIVCVTRQDADGQILSVIAEAAAPQSVEPVCFTSQAWLDEPTPSPKVVSATRRDGFDIPLYLAPPIAPTRPAQAEEWMPIETAPTGKVHSPLLHAIVASLLDDGSYYVEEAWFDDERREWWPTNLEFTDAHGSAIYPTHWRPLPAPPTKKEQP